MHENKKKNKTDLWQMTKLRNGKEAEIGIIWTLFVFLNKIKHAKQPFLWKTMKMKKTFDIHSRTVHNMYIPFLWKSMKKRMLPDR